jgi:hypothetical protein
MLRVLKKRRIVVEGPSEIFRAWWIHHVEESELAEVIQAIGHML